MTTKAAIRSFTSCDDMTHKKKNKKKKVIVGELGTLKHTHKHTP
jgi:hypothetical protein